LPEPRLVAALEAIAGISVLERPPGSHARELAPSEPVCLAVGGDCGEQIEKVEDDLAPSIVVDTEGNERLE
jgi:hypothetical protein